jgi:dCTP deaminase
VLQTDIASRISLFHSLYKREPTTFFYPMSESAVIEKSLLSDKAILKHLERGSVVIEPFLREHLSTSSYDVTLGQYYFREQQPEPGIGIYNPYSEKMVHKIWGEPLEAEVSLH